MAFAKSLKGTHTVDDRVQSVSDTVQSVDERVRAIDIGTQIVFGYW